VNPLDFPLLTDENIHPDVVSFLRHKGYDIRSVAEKEMFGQSDRAVLQMAYEAGQVVLTHDSDFGTLAITQDEPFLGIIYLRPGHIRPEFTIQTLQTVIAQSINATPPFIVVAEQSQQTVRIRVRQL
jgi:predicted nuclease of predicted toxin-antitoxin system